jgi:predicted TIM-barrel fold metal-dependent hydrolase
MKFTYIPLLLFCAALQNCGQVHNNTQQSADSTASYYTEADYSKVQKIDAHVHINTNDTGFAQQAAADNFKLLTINLDDVNEPPPMEVQQQFALHQVHASKGKIAYATSISIKHFNDTGWLQQQLAYLANSFKQGAVAVKIYKVIGLSLRDKNGKFVMIDDPRFTPIINYIEQNNISVLGHLGEPRNCWLPASKMTIRGDSSYFTQNPVYHMYLHPEYPTYEAEIAARDNMLAQHPNLRFVGAHLGSLEWNVDSLARRLDAYPNMAVDMAARICHLQYQASKNWQKVYDFIIKYQDRLLYATDLDAEVNTNITALKQKAHETWQQDWQFFTSSSNTLTSPDFDGTFKGMHLPKTVVDKIYSTNAQKWYPKAGF